MRVAGRLALGVNYARATSKAENLYSSLFLHQLCVRCHLRLAFIKFSAHHAYKKISAYPRTPALTPTLSKCSLKPMWRILCEDALNKGAILELLRYFLLGARLRCAELCWRPSSRVPYVQGRSTTGNGREGLQESGAREKKE